MSRRKERQKSNDVGYPWAEAPLGHAQCVCETYEISERTNYVVRPPVVSPESRTLTTSNKGRRRLTHQQIPARLFDHDPRC